MLAQVSVLTRKPETALYKQDETKIKPVSRDLFLWHILYNPQTLWGYTVFALSFCLSIRDALIFP